MPDVAFEEIEKKIQRIEEFHKINTLIAHWMSRIGSEIEKSQVKEIKDGFLLLETEFERFNKDFQTIKNNCDQVKIILSLQKDLLNNHKIKESDFENELWGLTEKLSQAESQLDVGIHPKLILLMNKMKKFVLKEGVTEEEQKIISELEPTMKTVEDLAKLKIITVEDKIDSKDLYHIEKEAQKKRAFEDVQILKEKKEPCKKEIMELNKFKIELDATNLKLNWKNKRLEDVRDDIIKITHEMEDETLKERLLKIAERI